MKTEKQNKKITAELFHTAFEDKPTHVANWAFEEGSNSYEEMAAIVYSASQNLNEDGWAKSLGKEYRSTSVGDYVKVDGVAYYVANMGFTKNPVNKHGEEIV